MTAALRPRNRPPLHLVRGAPSTAPAAPPSPRRSTSRGPTAVVLPSVAADVVARVLGTMFVPVARSVAVGLLERAPLQVRRGRPEVWAAAVAFLLAEQARLYDHDPHVTRSSLARELDVTLPTLRRRTAEVRRILHPLDLDLPDPDPDLL